MINILYNVAVSSWGILLDAAVFVVFGLIIAALLHAFIPSETIVKYMGGNDIKSVLLAALFGVPLPLCSCGVVPTAVALKKQGASKAATVSFLITTPESSIDSIAITYALLDPIITIFRPVAAFITGFVAGVGQIFFGGKEDKTEVQRQECAHCENHGEHIHSLGERLSSGLRFAFVELLSDISRWFLAGILVAGIISYAVPTRIIENYLGEGWLSMIIMLAVGLPLYVCAAASTPIAAALILKGASPGAALVFLLAGPATNAASLTVIAKMLGKRTAAIYLASIAVCAVMLGMLLNWLYQILGIDIHATIGHAHEMIPAGLKWGAAIPLTISIFIMAIRKKESSNA